MIKHAVQDYSLLSDICRAERRLKPSLKRLWIAIKNPAGGRVDGQPANIWKVVASHPSPPRYVCRDANCDRSAQVAAESTAYFLVYTVEVQRTFKSNLPFYWFMKIMIVFKVCLLNCRSQIVVLLNYTYLCVTFYFYGSQFKA